MKLDPNTNEWKIWDAASYGQLNPQKTDAQGQYAWNVPEGDYLVVYQLDGYKQAKYHVGTVPPPCFDVNMGLIAEKGAFVEGVTADTGGAFIEISFDQYVQASSFYNGNIAMSFTGTTQSKDVTVLSKAPVPAITAVKQAQGIVKEGAQLIITGTGFIGTKSVKFGNTAASFLVDSDRQIRVTCPAGSGTAAITVVAAGGTSKSYNVEYQISDTAKEQYVLSVSPNRGDGNRGTTVKITGKGFTGALGVKFGSMSAQSFKVISDTEITAVSSMGIGTVPVTVTTPYGNILVSNATFRFLESHIEPVGVSGEKLSTLDNKNSVTIPEGAFSSWQIATVIEMDAEAIKGLPAGYKVIGRALQIDFGVGVVPQKSIELKLAYRAADVPAGLQAYIIKVGDQQPLTATASAEQAAITSS
ncbi:MAG: IPT/TIG domain-containing protein [Bacillota bacterium]